MTEPEPSRSPADDDPPQHRRAHDVGADSGGQQPAAAPSAAPEKPQRIGLLSQVSRFFVTGVGSAVIDFGVTLLLVNLFGLGDFIARTVGFCAGTSSAYMLNRRFTFKAGPSTRRMAAVWVLYGFTFVINVGLYNLLFNILDNYIASSNLARVPAFVVGQGVATVLNFVIQRVVIFRLH